MDTLLNRALYYHRLFSMGMGMYGATRGFRAATTNHQDGTVLRKELLAGDRILNSMAMGVYYSMPVINLLELMRLANRLDIKYRGMLPSEDPGQYKEGLGYCTDAL
jgi:hypothetical protein